MLRLRRDESSLVDRWTALELSASLARLRGSPRTFWIMRGGNVVRRVFHYEKMTTPEALWIIRRWHNDPHMDEAELW